MQTNQLERLIQNVPASSIEDLKLLLSNNEPDKNCETNKLFNALIMMENILSILEISFSEISQDFYFLSCSPRDFGGLGGI